MIKEKIHDFYQGRVEIIDAATIVAGHVKDLLEQHSLLHRGFKTMQHFYISDYTESFAKSAKDFFGSEINIEPYSLW